MKKKKKKTDRVDSKKALVIILCAVLITIGVVSTIHSIYTNIDKKQYPIYLKIVNESDIGFDIRNDAISFGRIPAGAEGIIKVKISHNYTEPLLVFMEAQGPVKKFILITENKFVLEPNVTKTVEIHAVSTNNSIGEYVGVLDIFFKRR
ncbi:MAG: hypothetical protein QXG86_02320 [Candidatus Woesearchaeota archaeon]